MALNLLQHLSSLRASVLVNHDVNTDIITDEVASEKLALDRPFVYARYWPSNATTNAYYAVSVYNPTEVTHTFAHLSVVFTPGWASNYSREEVNSALAARDSGWPSYTGRETTLPGMQTTEIRLDFPVPASAPAGFKFLGLGLLWGTHPDPALVYYDIGRFYTMKN